MFLGRTAAAWAEERYWWNWDDDLGCDGSRGLLLAVLKFEGPATEEEAASWWVCGCDMKALYDADACARRAKIVLEKVALEDGPGSGLEPMEPAIGPVVISRAFTEEWRCGMGGGPIEGVRGRRGSCTASREFAKIEDETGAGADVGCCGGGLKFGSGTHGLQTRTTSASVISAFDDPEAVALLVIPI